MQAGEFGQWMADALPALRGQAEARVPCAGCTACCRSYQFVEIGPDEVETLARIPAELLFPAPGRPQGHRVMGYDSAGRCPMLGDQGCSIYEQRPMACRSYDCRLFAATGVELEDETKVAIGERVRAWRFEYRGDSAAWHRALRQAAAYLEHHAHELPVAVRPCSATERALAAIHIVGLFHPPAGTEVELARVVTTLAEGRNR